MSGGEAGLAEVAAPKRVPTDPGSGVFPPSPGEVLSVMHGLTLGNPVEPLDLDPEMKHLQDQLMQPFPEDERTASESAKAKVAPKKGFLKKIARPAADSSVVAPRSTKLVGGCPISKTKKTLPDPLSAERKAINKRAKEDARIANNLLGNANSKHQTSSRTPQWAVDRFYRMRRAITMLTTSSKECKFEFLTDEMRDDAMRMCEIAAEQACKEIDSFKLKTAAPNMWGIGLALQAHYNKYGTWKVSQEGAAQRMSWDTLQGVFKGNKGRSWNMQEIHYDDDVEALKTPKQVKNGVRRIVCTHNLGPVAKRKKKLACLDMLLKKGGEPGLHPDILAMKDPQVMRYETSSSSMAVQQRKQIDNWANKAAAKSKQRAGKF